MRIFYILSIALSLFGCATPSQVTEENRQEIIMFAEQLANQSGLLNPLEQTMIEHIKPIVTYYFLAPPIADYSIKWKIWPEVEILVMGRGNIFILENARVERKMIIKKSG